MSIKYLCMFATQCKKRKWIRSVCSEYMLFIKSFSLKAEYIAIIVLQIYCIYVKSLQLLVLFTKSFAAVEYEKLHADCRKHSLTVRELNKQILKSQRHPATSYQGVSACRVSSRGLSVILKDSRVDVCQEQALEPGSSG